MSQAESFASSSADLAGSAGAGQIPSAPIIVTLFVGTEGLGALSEDWRSVETHCGLFGKFDFFRLYSEHLVKDPNTIRYVRISDSFGVLAVIPLVPVHHAIGRFWTLRAFTLASSAHVPLTDFPVAPRANAASVASLLIRALELFGLPWSALVWSGMPSAGNAWQIARALRRRAFMVESSPSNAFDTSVDYETLRSHYSVNLRASLKKARRRLEESGGWRVVRSSSGDKSIQGNFQEFLRLEASGWKGNSGTESAIMLQGGTCGFYQALVSQDIRSFSSEIVLLESNGVAIAAQLSVFDGRCKHVLKIGYDENFARFSPGQVLLDKVLQDACGSPDVECVSLVTDMPWHQTWRPKALSNAKLVCFRNPISAWLFNAHRWLKQLRRSKSQTATTLWQNNPK